MSECPLCKQTHEVCDGVLEKLREFEARLAQLEDSAVSPLERSHREFVKRVGG